jgi:hypothetical protein
MIVTSAPLCPSYPPPPLHRAIVLFHPRPCHRQCLFVVVLSRSRRPRCPWLCLGDSRCVSCWGGSCCAAAAVAHGGGGCRVDSCRNRAADTLPAVADDALLPKSCCFRRCPRRRRAATALSATVLPQITPRCHRQPPPPGCHCCAADAAAALQPPPPCCSRCRRCHCRCPAASLPAAAELLPPLPPPPRCCH